MRYVLAVYLDVERHEGRRRSVFAVHHRSPDLVVVFKRGVYFLGPFVVGGGHPEPDVSVAIGLDRILHLSQYALAVDRLFAAGHAGERHPHAVHHFARRLRIESRATAFVVDKPVLVAHPVAGPDVREPVVVGLHVDLAAVSNDVAGAQADVRRVVAARHVQRALRLDHEGVVGPHEDV